MSRDKHTPLPVWPAPPGASNGNRKLVWWLMTSFAAFAVAVVALLYSSLLDEVGQFRRTEGNHGERMSALETRGEDTQRRLGTIETRLIAVDEKLDDVLREVQITNRKRR